MSYSLSFLKMTKEYQRYRLKKCLTIRKKPKFVDFKRSMLQSLYKPDIIFYCMIQGVQETCKIHFDGYDQRFPKKNMILLILSWRQEKLKYTFKLKTKHEIFLEGIEFKTIWPIISQFFIRMKKSYYPRQSYPYITYQPKLVYGYLFQDDTSKDD